jgi:hypothetical protein
MGLLSCVAGQADLLRPAHRVLGLLRSRLLNGAVTVRQAVNMLGAYHAWARVPEEEQLRAGNLEEVLYLAEQGFYGSMDSVKDSVLQFRADHDDEEPTGLLGS